MRFTTCLLAGLFLASPMRAQTAMPDSNSVSAQLQRMLAGIRTDSLKTGIWYDRVFPGAGLNQQSIHPDTVSPSRIRQAVAEMERAAMPGNESTAGWRDRYRLLRYRYRDSDTLPLAVLDVRYDILDTSTKAIRITADSLFESIPGVSESPFVQLEKSWIAPLAYSSLLRRTVHAVRFDPDAIFSTRNRQLVSITCTSGGVSRKLLPGDVMPVQIVDRHLRASFVLEFSDARTTPALVDAPASTDTTAQEWNNYYPDCHTEVIGGLPISCAQYPAPGGGQSTSDIGVVEVSYYYRGNCSGPSGGYVKKPVIFVDGFDPEDGRQHGELYGKQLKYYNTSAQAYYLLGDNLRAPGNGYDIVICNFPDYSNDTRVDPTWRKDHGAGFVEQNGLAIVAVLQKINAEMRAYNSTEQITLVGPSMGGLITRFALAYMEKRRAEELAKPDTGDALAWKHNVKLWVSFDSPHLGANIPVSAQMFLRFFGEDAGQEAPQHNLNAKIRSVAASQMLLHHEGAYPGEHVAGRPGFRDQFVASLSGNGLPNSEGWPLHTRKICVTNGSVGAQTLVSEGSVVAGGEEMLNMTSDMIGYVNTDRFLWGAFGQIGIHITVRTPAIAHLAHAYMKYAPSGFDGVNTKKEVFNAFVLKAAPGHRNTRPWDVYPFDAGISLDAAPGGLYDTPKVLADKGTKVEDYETNALQLLSVSGILPTPRWISITGSSVDFPIIRAKHSFIPTKSALAMRSGLHNLGEDLSNRDLVCSGETPFDAYYAADWQNTDHVALNQGIVNFVLAELNGNHTPHIETKLDIAGPTKICNNEYANYVLPTPQYAFQNLTWSVGTPFGQWSMEYHAPASGNGTQLVTATYNSVLPGGSVCPYKGTKEVEYGVAPIQLSVSNLISCQSTMGTLNIRPPQDVQSIAWSSSDDQIVSVSGIGLTGRAHAAFQDIGTARITCTMVSRCGTSQQGVTLKTKRCSGRPQIVLPNPPDGHPGDPTLAVTVVDDKNVRVANLGGSHVGLMDERKNEVAKGTMDINGEAILDISAVQPAAYTIVVTYPNGDQDEGDWLMLSEDGRSLVASPNPMVYGLDNTLTGRILNMPDTAGPFDIEIRSLSGLLAFKGRVDWPLFEVGTASLDPGKYLMSATNHEGETWSDSLEVEMEGAPYLSASPIPTSSTIHAALNKPIAGAEIVSAKIVDGQGITRMQADGLNASEFSFDLSDLIPGIYQLVVNDTIRIYTLLIQKQ